MCGKFTALKSYREVYSQLDAFAKATSAKPEDASDERVTYRVMGALPVIIFDKESGLRRIEAMRWGYPHPKDWKRPQPIHARSETIETTKAFAGSFLDGQRGIVLMSNFNEAADEGPTVQHTITPGEDKVLAAAFVWRSFDVGLSVPLSACCLVTVPANQLVATLPASRMPAFLEPSDWGKWLGEESATIDELKALLDTKQGAKWTMSREERAAKQPRQKPTVSDPGGLL